LESDKAIRRFADQTGGEVLNAYEPISLKAALEKSISSFRTQYTMGFNPSNPGAKGSFHRLAVKLAGQDICPECQVAARSGYYAGVSAPPPALSEIRNAGNRAPISDRTLIEQSILAAGTYIPELQDISFNVSTAEQMDSQGRPQLMVYLQIDFSEIDFTKVEERRACKVHVVTFYANEKGKMLGSDWKKIEGLLDKDNYDRTVKFGMSFSTTIPLKVRNQSIKIVVYDEGSEKMGSIFVRLQNKTFAK
jgi:hypothetical protein